MRHNPRHMKTKNLILTCIIGLAFNNVAAQHIGNYVTNGNFETLRPNALYPNFFASPPAYQGWSSIDTTRNGFFSHHAAFGNSPSNSPFSCDIQIARSGTGFVRNTVYIENMTNRCYFRNELKATLRPGVAYCVKYYVNLRECQPIGIDAFAAYFSDSSLDTISSQCQALTYLSPQIQNPPGNFVIDSVGWTLITGTFTAVGNERFMVLGNFLTSQSTGTIALTNPVSSFLFCDVNIDDASVTELNGAAYAGPDKLIYAGDSTFIGRQPDWAIDPGCIWYKLPNMTTSIDTISGLWVKPIVTSTYVVRQELDCSSVKWDTVVVRINTNLVDIDKLKALADEITLAPNPTSNNLKITLGMQTISDFSSYEIVNALGQIILKGQLQKNTADISTQDIAPGLYDIKLVCEFGTVTKKFVKTAD